MKTIHLGSNLPFRFAIRPCPFNDYAKLARFHYRSGNPGPVARCFGLYAIDLPRGPGSNTLVGIVVYGLPPVNSPLRDLATADRFRIADRAARAKKLNRELRTIARVIIDPRFRSLGLAAALVRHTLPHAGTPWVEASAVMGAINPFFEKAGMKRIDGPPSRARAALQAALTHVGLTPPILLDTPRAIRHIESLPPTEKRFILRRIHEHFINPRQGAYSSAVKHDLPWIIPRLTQHALAQPAYFIWKRPSR